VIAASHVSPTLFDGSCLKGHPVPDITARRIGHLDASVERSPSGLPTRYLVDGTIGSAKLFVAEQVLRPGDRVLLHTHPEDEVLIFRGGSGIARLEEDDVHIGDGVTLFIPAGVSHGFSNTGDRDLEVLVIFPGPAFAQTTLLESGTGLAESGGLT
jgi:mannose-6-phosphate isomerase-like protein (cupin superfamily)